MPAGDIPVTALKVVVRPDVTIPAGGGSVVPTEGAQVKSVIWRNGSEPNQAEVQWPKLRLGGVASFSPNTPISITIKLPGGGKSIPVFVGRIAARFGEYDRSSEDVSIMCLGPRWDLSRDYVLGQERRAQKLATPGSFVLTTLSGYPCVFNQGSKGNKFIGDASGATTGSGLEVLFHGDSRRRAGATAADRAKFEWTLADMIAYVYRQRLRLTRFEYRTFGSGDPSVLNVVGSPLKEPSLYKGPGTGLVLYDVDVDGLPLNEAIDVIMSAGAIRWWLKPVSVGVAGPVGALTGHHKKFISGMATVDGGPSVTHSLFMPAVGGAGLGTGLLPASPVTNPALPAVAPDHSRVMLKDDHTGVVSSMAAFGGRGLVQAEFDLVPLWRASDETAIIGTPPIGEGDTSRQRSIRDKLNEGTGVWQPSLVGDASEPRHFEVGRLFGLDVTGYELGIDATPYPWTDDGTTGGTPLFASSGAFHVGQRLFRRVLKAASPIGVSGESKDHAFEQIRPAKMVVFHPDLPGTSEPYRGSWELDPERCAIRIMTNEIDILPFFNWPTAKFASKVRLTLALQEDFRLVATSGLPGTAGPFSDVVAYSNIRNESSYGPRGLESDPLSRLTDVATNRLEANLVPNVSASVIIAWIRTDIEPGHWVTSISGRDIALRGQVEEVHFDFVEQTTTIVLEDPVMFLTEQADDAGIAAAALGATPILPPGFDVGG